MGQATTRETKVTENERLAIMIDAAREAIDQTRYQGFGDPVSRSIYVREVLQEALDQVMAPKVLNPARRRETR